MVESRSSTNDGRKARSSSLYLIRVPVEGRTLCQKTCSTRLALLRGHTKNPDFIHFIRGGDRGPFYLFVCLFVRFMGNVLDFGKKELLL